MSSVKMWPGSLPQGKEKLLIDKAPTAAGTDIAEIGIDADTVIISLFVSSLSGDLDIVVDTLAGSGDITVINFPTISAPTTNLFIKKAAAIMDKIRVTATYTDAVDYEVYVRGVGTGEASVRILGSNDAEASQTDIGTSATIIIPAALTDRSGLIIKNNDSSANLFIGYTALEATLANGYPIGPGESIGIDIASGQELFGIASAGTIDVRIMEAGS